MRRREVIAAGAAVLLCPRAAEAQPAARVYRPAVLSPSSTSYDTLRGELAKLGFVEGRNLAIDARVGVINGKAILQGPAGIIGVSTGDLVPGVGRVQSIARLGGRWTVATNKGVISAR